MSQYGAYKASDQMESSPSNPVKVMESHAEQKNIASFYAIKKGTSAHEITPASVTLAKTIVNGSAEAKKNKAAVKGDAKVVAKVTAQKVAGMVAEGKAALAYSDAIGKCVKSYFPGTNSLCITSQHHTLVLLIQNICCGVLAMFLRLLCWPYNAL